MSQLREHHFQPPQLLSSGRYNQDLAANLPSTKRTDASGIEPNLPDYLKLESGVSVDDSYHVPEQQRTQWKPASRGNPFSDLMQSEQQKIVSEKPLQQRPPSQDYQ